MNKRLSITLCLIGFFIPAWLINPTVFNPSVAGQNTITGYLINMLSGKCLDPVGSALDQNGTAVQLNECDESADQYWSLSSDNFLWNPATGKCLDVMGNPGTERGTALQLWDCEKNAETDQRWTITPTGYLQNLLSNLCIDVPGAAGKKSGSLLNIYDCEFSSDSSDQRWFFSDTASSLPEPENQNVEPENQNPESVNQNPASASFGTLVFDSDVDGDKDIYTMDISTRELTQLTDSPGYDGAPAWSPDGERIVFISERNGTKDLFTMNSDGSDQKQVFRSDHGNEFRPSWSPDGRILTYESDVFGDLNIFTFQFSNNLVEQCTKDPAIDMEPHFAPDGNGIVFTTMRSGGGDIYFSTCTLGTEYRLTTTGNYDAYGSYSPNKEQLLFHSKRDGAFHIYLKDFTIRAVTGENETMISPPDQWDAAPSWSPDGRMIAFVRGNPFEVCVMTLETRETTCLTDNQASEEYPSFRP